MLSHRDKGDQGHKDTLRKKNFPTWIDARPIDGWKSIDQMAREDIGQLQGVNADTEHLEGQGVNQPRQNEKDSMRFDSLTSLGHSHCNEDENGYGKPDSQ